MHPTLHNLARVLTMMLLPGLLVTVCKVPIYPPGNGGVTPPPASTESAAAHTDHSSMDHSTMGGAAPFDAAFIDDMTAHHAGAVAMAQALLEKTERPELLEMAENVIRTQSAEIEQMADWRATWYPDEPASAGIDMEMGAMEVADDTSIPYDRRFLEAMIDHHAGAIAMAEHALEGSEHPELAELAATIIAAQQAEVAQMEQWLQQWYPE